MLPLWEPFALVCICNKWFLVFHLPLYTTFSVCRSACSAQYLRNCISCNYNFCCTCVIKWWYLQQLFSFFFNFNFWVVSWVKKQKMVQNDKKFCPPQPIPQEPSIKWLSFKVHVCKMFILGLFKVFSKFCFSGSLVK